MIGVSRVVGVQGRSPLFRVGGEHPERARGVLLPEYGSLTLPEVGCSGCAGRICYYRASCGREHTRKRTTHNNSEYTLHTLNTGIRGCLSPPQTVSPCQFARSGCAGWGVNTTAHVQGWSA